jgi:hypothetical protein
VQGSTVLNRRGTTLSAAGSVIRSYAESNHGPMTGGVHIHAEQHAVLNGLADYGYSRIGNGTKVRKMKTGSLDTVKAAVLASPALRKKLP